MNVQDIIKRYLSLLNDPGMTRYCLAKESGVPKTLVYELSNGNRGNVNLKNLLKMQKHLENVDKTAA